MALLGEQELARRMDDHIEDSVVFLQHLEIV